MTPKNMKPYLECGLDDIDFSLFSIPEVIDLLLLKKDRKYDQLIIWLTRAKHFREVIDDSRIAMANHERAVEAVYQMIRERNKDQD